MDGILFAGPYPNGKLAAAADAEGFVVAHVSSVEEMRAFVIAERPRMVVLDRPGAAWLTELRKVDKTVPLLVVAPSDWSQDDEAEALENGADAVTGRGERPGERLVFAWIDAVYRRLERCPFGQERYVFGNVEVDVFRRTVKKRGWRLMMSATEFDLLVHLVRNDGRVVSRDEILREVWKYETCPTTRTVDNFICKLRRKIEDEPRRPRHLKTIKGTGYRFEMHPKTT